MHKQGTKIYLFYKVIEILYYQLDNGRSLSRLYKVNEIKRIQKIIETQGVDELEARFIMGLADGEIDGDVLDGVPLNESPTLSDIALKDKLNKSP